MVAFRLSGLAGVLALSAVADPRSPAQDKSATAISPFDQPKQFEAGKATQYALWFDKEESVWRLRAAAQKDTSVVFTGSVRAVGGKMAVFPQGLVKSKNPTRADWVLPHKDGAGFDFRLYSSGGSHGVDIKPESAVTELSFKLLITGGEAPKKVLIGKAGRNPEKIPFTLPAFPKE